MGDRYEVLCPHAGCIDALHIVFRASYSLLPEDLNPDAIAPRPEDAHGAAWSVECTAGHVLLLPEGAGCPCDDSGGPDCPHNEDDYDWSGDHATFRARDIGRLRDVLRRLSQPAGGGDHA